MKALGSYLAVVVLCALAGLAWLGWVIVAALVVARMIPRRHEELCEPIQAQVVGGPMDGLEFDLHL